MSEENFENRTEWRSQLSPERRARIEASKSRFTERVPLFREFRHKLGLSQVEAARRLGTTQANISKMEKRPSVDVEQLKKLAAESDYEVVVVLKRDGERIEFAA